MNIVKATLKDGRTVEFLPDMIGQGGMKQVYYTSDKRSVICFFKDQSASNDPKRLARLESVLGSNNPTITRAQGGICSSQGEADYFKNLFCWPTGIVMQPRIGVMTPAYESNFYFGSGRFKGKGKEGRWFSSPKLRKMLPAGEKGDWLQYLMLCTRMARAIRKMHMSGLAHSDLSCKNVLIDPQKGTCAVIDIDSLVVTNKFLPDVLGTPGYIAPEVIATQNLPLGHPQRTLPSNWTDLHALAVLIYEYLLRRHPLRGPRVNSTASAEEDERLSMGEKALFIENPQDPSNRPRNIQVSYECLGPYLSKVSLKTFVDGLHTPTVRTTAAAWEQALCRTADLLIPCGNGSCDEKWFVYRESHRPQCPWCGWKLKNPMPVLEFHYAPRKGQFRPENHSLVAWDKRTIHQWHVFTDKKPDENTNPESLADIQFYQGQWILINRQLDSMVSPSGNPVPKGQAVALKDSEEILLSKSEKGRLVVVKMIP